MVNQKVDELSKKQSKPSKSPILDEIHAVLNSVKCEQECRHLSCSSCSGTGIKKDGTSCVHMISCQCKRCTPFFL